VTVGEDKWRYLTISWALEIHSSGAFAALKPFG